MEESGEGEVGRNESALNQNQCPAVMDRLDLLVEHEREYIREKGKSHQEPHLVQTSWDWNARVNVDEKGTVSVQHIDPNKDFSPEDGLVQPRSKSIQCLGLKRWIELRYEGGNED